VWETRTSPDNNTKAVVIRDRRFGVLAFGPCSPASGWCHNGPVTALRLTRHNLDKLGIPVPGYDRSGVTTGIVHIGVGGFHRAHQAMYVDRLLTAGVASEWGICGMGVLPGDARMRDALVAQDYLYTLVLKHPDGHREARVIGSIVDYVLAPDDPAAAVARLADPRTKIVSLTVTEGGYNIKNATGEFDTTNAGVQHDLASPDSPKTTFGLVVAALAARRAAGVAPFTVMSCDNIQGNGDVARAVFTSFASLVDPELAEWVQSRVSFPNCMVDRITPQTTDVDRAELAEQFGVIDAWPTVCEPFVQWVLEDAFPDGRPPFELAEVQVVDDVVPYEQMKLRLLNASHQGIAYFGTLAGHTYVHDAMADELFAPFLLAYMRDEALPTLGAVPGVDLHAYCDELIQRFSNPQVADTCARLAFDGSERVTKFLLPVVFDRRTAGKASPLSAAICASWARYCEGTDEQGEPITVEDQRVDQLRAAAGQQDDALAFLRQRDLFGDLVDTPEFTDPYLETLGSLHEHGARATLAALLG